MSSSTVPETLSRLEVDGGISGLVTVRRVSSPYAGAPDLVLVDSEAGSRLVLTVDEAAALTAALSRVVNQAGTRAVNA